MMAIRSKPKVKILTTVSEVIDALGGNPAVRSLAGMSDQSLSNSRSAGRFPSNTFLLITEALAERDLAAAPALWAMKEKVAEGN